MAAGLAATFARGAWLALAVGALAFWLARTAPLRSRLGNFRTRAFLLAAGAFAAVGAVVLLLRPDTVAHLVNVASLRGRVWMWAVATLMIRDAPWGGFGLGSFGMVFPRYQAEAFNHPWAASFLTNGSFTPHAHNDFLQLWPKEGYWPLSGWRRWPG
jgi:O-antigen ligase